MPRPVIFISAVVVAVLNLASIGLGFWAFKLTGGTAQLAVQVPVCLVCGILLVMTWVVGFRRVNGLVAGEDHMAVFLLAFPVGAVVLVAVHYVVTGYLTSVGNIIAVVALQFVQNVLALPLAAGLERRLRRKRHGVGDETR
ncbi:hypothetical protein DRQ50_05620 [bacterium]|nr:MAG: hypothetical protein DRQ50_05620 [bacterium]